MASKESEKKTEIKKIKWGSSEEKFLLREDIISGVVTKEMKAKEVYKTRECYSKFKYENFRSNLRTLRKAVKDGLGRAERDEAAFLHDKNLFGKKADGAWHRSDAYKVLKHEIKKGKLEGKKPKEIYNSKSEFKSFPLPKFRNQIYHEIVRMEKEKLIKEGKHPRFLRRKHDPRTYKVKSTEIMK